MKRAMLRRSLALSLIIVTVVASDTIGLAGETVRPINERFAETAKDSNGEAAGSAEAPDFQRHISPLLGRLGCNGRACHGSFQGQGGFRLSLFGYDFKSDHEALTKGDEPRVDRENPLESLILRKPTLSEDHEGGKRFAKDGWEYQVLRQWIESGAKPVEDEAAKLERLEITPAEIVLHKTGETAQLKVVAHWSDGSAEDVTPITRFRTNDEGIAKIDETGKIVATGAGDTHVVAFYDNGVVPVPVLLPVSDRTGERYPSIAAPTKIDELILAKLKKLGVVPSELATDTEFLRRVSLDITGTLPTSEEIIAFAADQSADKRERKIDELLARPAHAAWWATRLCDLTGNNPAQMRQVFMPAGEEWYNWMYERIRENAPYDKIVEGLLMALSRQPGQSFEDFCREVASYYGENKTGDFTKRQTMPHYWMRQNFRNVDDRVMGFGYSFMGIQIQCAQCHKHPFDQWTKDDFDQFKPFFTRVRYGVAPGTKEQSDEMLVALGLEPDPKKRTNNNKFGTDLRKMVGEGKLVPHQEVYLTPANQPANRKNANNGNGRRNNAPSRERYGKLLGGERVELSQYDDERRALVDWLRSDPRRYLARAFVNRVWANYFNVGIIHPTDDMNLANPASNADLLDYLADGFVEHAYDMKWLHREICKSHAYQRSWRPNETNKLDTRNFSRAVPRRLPAEVAYDAIVTATAGDEQLKKLIDEPKSRSIGLGNLPGLNRGGGGNRTSAYALAVFGRPARATNCDCERSPEPSLLQTIYLQNDQETLSFIERPDGWMKQTERQLATPDKGGVKATTVSFKDDGLRPNDESAQNREKSEGDEQARTRARASLANLERRLGKLKADQASAEVIEKIERRIKRLREQSRDDLQKTKEEPDRKTDGAEEAKSPVSTQRLAEAVRDGYLRTLSREPTAAETARAIQHIQEATNTGAGLRDLMWALINTKEFIVNH